MTFPITSILDLLVRVSFSMNYMMRAHTASYHIRISLIALNIRAYFSPQFTACLPTLPRYYLLCIKSLLLESSERRWKE
jgi:hypothetical protein